MNNIIDMNINITKIIDHTPETTTIVYNILQSTMFAELDISINTILDGIKLTNILTSSDMYLLEYKMIIFGYIRLYIDKLDTNKIKTMVAINLLPGYRNHGLGFETLTQLITTQLNKMPQELLIKVKKNNTQAITMLEKIVMDGLIIHYAVSDSYDYYVYEIIRTKLSTE